MMTDQNKHELKPRSGQDRRSKKDRRQSKEQPPPGDERRKDARRSYIDQRQSAEWRKIDLKGD